MVGRVCEMKPAVSTGPEATPLSPECAAKLPMAVLVGLILPDVDHPGTESGMTTGVSNPQFVTKLPAIASHSLGMAWTTGIAHMKTASPRQTVSHVKCRCAIFTLLKLLVRMSMCQSLPH